MAPRVPTTRRSRTRAPGAGGYGEAGATEVLLHAAMAEAPVAMLLLDRRERIVFANRQAGWLLDRDADALAGRAVHSVLPAPDAVESGREEPHGPACHAIDTVSADGVPRSLELLRTPLAGGAQGASLLTLLDRTRRAQLEREAAARCAALADLSQMAMLAQLSAALVHEINQPLAAVVGNGQAALHFLAEDPPALEDVRECLTDIVANGRRASAVVRRQRAMIEGDRNAPAELAFGTVVGEAVQLLRNELLNRGLVLLADVDEGLPAVAGNRVQLQQVIAGLVMQVALRQPQPARRAGVRITARPMDPNTLRVSVGALHGAADDAATEELPAGDGVAPELGLDLATCRVIVEAHGGRLWGARSERHGLRLGFDLPVASPAPRPVDAMPQ